MIRRERLLALLLPVMFPLFLQVGMAFGSEQDLGIIVYDMHTRGVSSHRHGKMFAALSQAEKKKLFDTIIEVLKGPDVFTDGRMVYSGGRHANAAHALEIFYGPDALPALSLLIKMAIESPFHEEFASAVAKIGKPAVPDIVRALNNMEIEDDNAPGLLALAGKLDPTVLSSSTDLAVPVCRFLNGKWGDKAAAVLGKMSPQVVPVICKYLEASVERFAFVNAGAALSKFGSKSDAAVAPLLKSKNPEYLANLTEMLEGIATYEYVDCAPGLCRIWLSTDPAISEFTRKRAEDTLVKLGPAAAKPLNNLLFDDVVETQLKVMSLLVRMGTKAEFAVPGLLKLLDSDRTELRCWSAVTLLLVSPANKRLACQRVGVLLKSHRYRGELAGILERAGLKLDLEPVIVTDIAGYVRDSKEPVQNRSRLIGVLGLSGSARAVPCLTDIVWWSLHDRSLARGQVSAGFLYTLRKDAIRALGKLGPVAGGSSPALMQVMLTVGPADHDLGDLVFPALKEMKEGAAPALAALLTYFDFSKSPQLIPRFREVLEVIESIGPGAAAARAPLDRLFRESQPSDNYFRKRSYACLLSVVSDNEKLCRYVETGLSDSNHEIASMAFKKYRMVLRGAPQIHKLPPWLTAYESKDVGSSCEALYNAGTDLKMKSERDRLCLLAFSDVAAGRFPEGPAENANWNTAAVQCCKASQSESDRTDEFEEIVRLKVKSRVEARRVIEFLDRVDEDASKLLADRVRAQWKL